MSLKVSIETGPPSSEVTEFWRAHLQAQDEWAGLAATPEWFEYQSGASIKPPIVVVGRTGEQIVLIAPIVFTRSTHKTTWRTPLFRAGNVTGRICGGDVVATDGGRASLPEFFNTMMAQVDAADIFIADHVTTSNANAIFGHAGRNAWFPHVLQPPMPHYRLVLPPTIAELSAVRSASSLKKIRGRERRLAADVGPCHVIEIRQPSDWAPYSRTINDVMNTAWQAQLLGHQFDMEAQRGIAERGWLRCFLLMTGSKPAAFVFGLQNPRVFTYEQVGFDRTLGQYSPGTILLYRMIEKLYEADTPECIDYGEGDAEWKRQWSNHAVESQPMLIVRGTMALRARAGLARGYRVSRSWVRDTLDYVGAIGSIRKMRKSRAAAIAPRESE